MPPPPSTRQCMLSLSDAKRLALSVRFDLKNYLFEYAE